MTKSTKVTEIQSKNRPNIVIFNPDSYRGDVVGHLGNRGAVTPNLDSIINYGGVSFSNAFAQNPYCTPSRCSFMTGLYPHVHGHRSMKYMLRTHEPNLFSVLKREGYANWMIGKNDLFSVESVDDYMKYGVVKVQPPEGEFFHHRPTPLPKDDPRRECFYEGVATRYGDGSIYGDNDYNLVKGAVDIIDSSSEDQPFCLFVPIAAPHPTYIVEKEFYDMIDPELIPLRLSVPERTNPYLDAYRVLQRSDEMDEEAWLEIKRVYYAMCTKVDFFFGQVVNALKAKGIYDDTLIIFLSDHGDFAGDYDMVEKTVCSLDDALIRSPLIIKPPAKMGAKPGIRNQLVELIDMTATIYDILGIEPGYTCQGRTLCSALQGDETEIRDAVFAETGARRDERQFMNVDCESMSSDSFYGKRYQMRFPRDMAGSYGVSVRSHSHKYIYRPYTGQNALFDLKADPGEISNLSGNPRFADLEQSMKLRLLEYYAKTADVIPYDQDPRNI